MTDDAHVRAELGAYVLGALEPGERRRVEAHVADCSSCRDELAGLSGLPPLLDRITVDEAAADLRGMESRVAAASQRAAAAAHAGLRREVARWRATAAAALLVAVAAGLLAWAPWQRSPEPVAAPVVAAADEAASVEGTVAAYAWEWGTTIELRLASLPERQAYRVWAVSTDGRREQAGIWGPTDDGSAMVRGASSIQGSALQRVEVTDAAGARLLTAELPAQREAAQPAASRAAPGAG